MRHASIRRLARFRRVRPDRDAVDQEPVPALETLELQTRLKADMLSARGAGDHSAEDESDATWPFYLTSKYVSSRIDL
jgi:hypothetical protein